MGYRFYLCKVQLVLNIETPIPESETNLFRNGKAYDTPAVLRTCEKTRQCWVSKNSYFRRRKYVLANKNFKQTVSFVLHFFQGSVRLVTNFSLGWDNVYKEFIPNLGGVDQCKIIM